MNCGTVATVPSKNSSNKQVSLNARANRTPLLPDVGWRRNADNEPKIAIRTAIATTRQSLSAALSKIGSPFSERTAPRRELPSCITFVIGSELHIGTIRMLG
jgi:hypothetical protein